MQTLRRLGQCSVLVVDGCGGDGVKWPWVSGLNGLQLINSVRVSLLLLPLPAGDPSRRDCVQGEAESPNGRRYEKQRCWCVTAQCYGATSPSLSEYFHCSSEQ